MDEAPIEGNVTMYPPDGVMRDLNVTKAEIDAYAESQTINDKAGYAATEAARKGLVGADGTNIQLANYIEGNGFQFVYGQALVFLIKNRIKPTALDVFLLSDMIVAFTHYLSEGRAEAVNRRAELIAQGILNPQGDDVVPDFVRNEWL